MKVIRGKSALVTGAASGIGRAIALRLAEEGANLYLLDIDLERLDVVAEECRGRGVKVETRRCDVSQPAQITAVVQHLLATWDGVDILVNNAGITYYGRTTAMTADHWNRLLAVNLHAPIQFVRELMPSLLKRRDAHVLNVASICGLVGLARVAAYSTSKFGLVGFSESLRHECGRMGLGVTALCPGLVDTSLFSSALRGRDVKQQKAPPKWILITPEQVANSAIRAIYRNKAVVVMQPMSRAIYFVKRFMPWLLDLAHHLRRNKQAPEIRKKVVTDADAAFEPARKKRAA
jgi:short-subunit dehydrogenase